MCGELDEENKNNSDPNEKFILEDEVIENTDDGDRSSRPEVFCKIACNFIKKRDSGTVVFLWILRNF